MADSDKALFDSLDVRHPDYVAWEPNWKLFRDILGESTPDMRAYLPRGEFESDDVYRARVDFAKFIPESPIAVEKITEGVFQRSPSRSGVDEFKAFLDDADLRGSPWDDVIERIGRRLVGYGTIRVLVNSTLTDLPRETDGSIRRLSRAEELELGVRPYVINYNPLSVIDWQTDRFGLLERVRIREETHVTSNRAVMPGTSTHDKLVRFIDYTRTAVEWREFRVRDNKNVALEEEDARVHNLGIVPMVIENYPEEITPLVGAGFIRYIARADLRKIAAESDLHWDAYIHAHPTAVYKGADLLSKIGVGSSSYVQIAPDEDISYMNLPESAFEAIAQVIRLNIEAMHRHAGTDPLGQLQPGASTFEASGVARAWSFSTSEGRKFKQISLKFQRVEQKVFEILARYALPDEQIPATREKIFKGTIQYPEEFDPSSAETLMTSTERSSQIVNSETYIRIMVQRVASALIGEVPDELMEKVLREIKSSPLLIGPSAALSPFDMPQIETDEEEESEKEPEEETEESEPEDSRGGRSPAAQRAIRGQSRRRRGGRGRRSGAESADSAR